jgi:hypothetical protein
MWLIAHRGIGALSLESVTSGVAAQEQLTSLHKVFYRVEVSVSAV